MSTGKHREIERKYLVRYPDPKVLQAQPGVVRWEIVQIYLSPGENGETRRIRQVVCDGQIRYYRTFKRRLTDLSAEEDEREITPVEYFEYAREQAAGTRPVVKTRYRIPYGGHTLEFDIYPFWDDRAILEIELGSEHEGAQIPEYAQIVRDVSGDYAYKNSQLAFEVPMEEI